MLGRQPAHLRRITVIALAVVLLALVGAIVAILGAAPGIVAGRLRGMAASRGLTASWTTLRLRWPGADVDGLLLVNAQGDTAVRARHIGVSVTPMSVLMLSPEPSLVSIEGARVDMRSLRGEAEAAAAEPEEASPARKTGPLRVDHMPRFRSTARNLARVLTSDPDRLPRVSFRDLEILARDAEDEQALGARFDSLEWTPGRGETRFEAAGVATLEDESPFAIRLVEDHDGRLRGELRFEFQRSQKPLVIAVDGRVERSSHPRSVRLADSSRVLVGSVPVTLSALVSTDGPRIAFAVSMQDVRAREVKTSTPPELLGPLQELGVSGAFDYDVDFDLDLDKPDSLRFDADVTSHGLRLDPDGGALNLTGLDRSFTAEIHLPRGRSTVREIGPGNPHFRMIDVLDSNLVHAVVTNEDGGFFRHRGFNTGAFREALIENLHAGRYRRGAGTITMQLARNLYLGHERRLARKGQEIVLAWILEHLTGVPKERLLEIYLNIIEWGPGIHGADEATEYYFGHGAKHVTIDEALFLATVVPSPLKWRNRFDKTGELRTFERQQMHFIGRAMIRKGWLAEDKLPPVESLRVELRGPARQVLFPPPDSSRASDASEAPAAADSAIGAAR